MDATNLIAYLPFDTSTTEDYCGNSWTATGNVAISTDITKSGTASVHLPSGAFLTANNIINLNAEKWTFSAWCYVVSSSGANGFFGFGEGQTRRGIIAGADGIYIATSGGDSWQDSTSSRFPNVKNQWTHIEVVKDGTSLKFFQDGALFWSTTIGTLNDTGVFLIGGNSYGYSNDVYFDEILFYDGVALHTEDFTPPTDDELFDLKMQFAGRIHQHFVADVETLIYNAPKGWRYLNPGTSSLIEFDGVDVAGDYSKSVTGVCFRGGSTSQDCFNTPAGLKEVWIRFDLWTQRQGSGGVSYSIGHRSSSTGYIIGVSRSTTATDTWTFKITGTAGTIHGTPDGISRCLLHIKSHATDGLCELNVNGDTISTSGNINDGRDITPLIIWANDSGYCYFSNLIVSESPLPLDAGWHRDVIPAEAQITAPKLNVRLRGADVQIPLRTKRETGSVTVRVGNSNFYCPATATASLQAAVTFRLDDANHRLINSFG